VSMGCGNGRRGGAGELRREREEGGLKQEKKPLKGKSESGRGGGGGGLGGVGGGGSREKSRKPTRGRVRRGLLEICHWGGGGKEDGRGVKDGKWG